MYKFLSLRLNPDQDLKKQIQYFCEQNQINAGCIVSAIGSLKKCKLRLANSSNFFESSAYFEMISLSGTLSVNGCHLHMAVADQNGHVMGGHLVDENIIYTTCEVVILKLEDQVFHRVHDPVTGFKELKIT